MTFPGNIDLSTLDGVSGFTLNGEAAFDRSGFSVASAGDINGDGFADLIVGSPNASPNGTYSGKSYVVFGKALGFGPTFELTSLNGSNGFKLNGVAGQDRSGYSVASAGDVNGDGLDDLIIGASGANGYAGVSYVVFGKTSAFGANLELSSLDGSTGFKLSGVAGLDGSGDVVRSAGDINGDGFADLIIGAPFAKPNGSLSGTSYVVFGKPSGFAPNLDLSSLNGSSGFKLNGLAAYDRSGHSASAGDVNGDGFDDVIVASRGADSYAGTTYVVFGMASGFGAEFDLSSLDGSNGFKLDGLTNDDRSGFSVASAGDINGDGFADLIIGAPYADWGPGFFSGVTYVVFGKPSSFGAEFDLSSLDGSNGFKLNGGAGQDRAGYSVASAGDVNGDGFADLIVSTPFAGGAGATYVVFGKASSFAANLDLSTLDGTEGFKLSSPAPYDFTGGSVAGAGDINADGFDDLIVGAPGASPNGYTSGASYVVFGVAPTEAVTRNGTAADNDIHGGAFNDRLNGNGGDDTLIGLGGNDRLNGGAGADTMIGGTGNDTYVVDNAGGVVTEATGEGGADTVLTTLSSYTLAAEVERLAFKGTGNFSGTGNDLANILTGATGDDILTGLGGNDRLNGGAGADTMLGGTGNDLYFVDNAGDVVTEAPGEGTADTVFTALSSYTLADEVERLAFTGIGNFSGTGNDLANILKGGTGDDTLDGGGGRDRLTGDAGEDTFAFSSPLLVANFASVTDFTTGTDTIALASSTFAAAGPSGPLATAAFFMGTRAHDGDDRIIYNSANGYLMYDADGNGAQAAVTFSKVAPGLSMTADDFKIV